MQAVQTFIWFLRLGLSSAFVWVTLALLALATVIVLLRSEPVERWKYWLLSPLPLLWIFVGLWGGVFWLHWERTPISPNPAWVGLPVPIALCIYLALGIGLVVYLRGIRWFVALFAILNLCFMLLMAALTTMAITGDWL